MMDALKLVVLALVVCIVAVPASAEDPITIEVEPAEADAQPTGFPKALTIIGACLAAALAAIGGGYGVSRIGSACIESIARQPEAGGAMFAPMVIAAAMVEGGMLMAILVCAVGVFFA